MRVPGVCADPKQLEVIAAHHGTPRPPPTKGCESRRRLVRIVPPIYGLWHCFTHTSCVCNDMISCINRVVGKVPLPTQQGINMMRREASIISRKLGHPAPLSLEDSLSTFKGTKNKLYTRAYESLKIEPLGFRDARIKAFVKAEKFNPADKVNPDPRMIQARDPRYNLHLARFLRPIEHHIYGLRINGARSVTKCLNPRQRFELLEEKWAMFRDPVCFSIDCSRWDKHVSMEVLEIEHSVYRSAYPAEVDLKQLLDWQKINRCTTSNGVKYTVFGGRMSGDMNTALGNCLLMCIMVKAAMRHLGLKWYQVMDDGDDCLVLVERSDLTLLKAELPRTFLMFGQELKLENITDNIHHVVFCQSRPTWNGERYIFARDWRKVLSQSCCGTKHWNDPRMVQPMFGLIGDCEMAQHAGVPILQVFAERLRELSGGRRAQLQHLDSSYQYRVGSWYNLDELNAVPTKTITWMARLEFEITWGVDVTTQLAIENSLRSWTPSNIFRDCPDEFIANDWTQRLDPGVSNPGVL